MNVERSEEASSEDSFLCEGHHPESIYSLGSNMNGPNSVRFDASTTGVDAAANYEKRQIGATVITHAMLLLESLQQYAKGIP